MINDLNENHNINSLNVTNDENDNTLKKYLPNYNIIYLNQKVIDMKKIMNKLKLKLKKLKG